MNNLQILNQNPKIFMIDYFISPLECQHLIEISKDKLKQAMVSDIAEGKISSGRTGSNCWIEHNYDSIVIEIINKISKIVGMPSENAEHLQIIHYSETQKYEYHYDAFPLEKNDKSRRLLKNGGQRLLTALVYLNEVEGGGETGFKNLNLEIKPKMGRIIVFENTLRNSLEKHPDSLHSGRPVIKGEKYAFNLWYRHLPRTEIFDIDEFLDSKTDEIKNNKFLEIGDFFPFIKINNKEIYNIVDNKRFLFIGIKDITNFKLKLNDNYNNFIYYQKGIPSNNILNISTKSINFLELIENKIVVYYCDSNRRILDKYILDSIEELELTDKSFEYRIPYVSISDVLSEDLLEKVINFYHSNKKTVHSSATKHRYHVHPNAELEKELDNKLSRSLFPEIRKVFNMEVKYRELYKISSYNSDESGQFHSHRDTPYPYQHRKLGLILFLNDDYEGGELEFPEYNTKIKPKRNTAIVFPGINAHKVNLVTKGNRMNIISFICSEIEDKTKDNILYLVKSDYFQENKIKYSEIYPL